ncbi:predicted protein [Sclerotinia sclerotiorum 1980 UF-70]|uniref:Uncharacterized protein n=1 Tax=Sclerotinia sclerotiorum (strain ATCC 18683 / 1980 / Ss-1) TaxID=665079 RepID=A7EBN3_SCLS1|nr:predicted protein [Sclerotinia sclerotiorum 1980 UF-70]EDN99861.1 predicted protein [Sclerotinia sclerotiorum 1980 UF-70]
MSTTPQPRTREIDMSQAQTHSFAHCISKSLRVELIL